MTIAAIDLYDHLMCRVNDMVDHAVLSLKDSEPMYADLRLAMYHSGNPSDTCSGLYAVADKYGLPLPAPDLDELDTILSRGDGDWSDDDAA